MKKISKYLYIYITNFNSLEYSFIETKNVYSTKYEIQVTLTRN